MTQQESEIFSRDAIRTLLSRYGYTPKPTEWMGFLNDALDLTEAKNTLTYAEVGPCLELPTTMERIWFITDLLEARRAVEDVPKSDPFPKVYRCIEFPGFSTNLPTVTGTRKIVASVQHVLNMFRGAIMMTTPDGKGCTIRVHNDTQAEYVLEALSNLFIAVQDFARDFNANLHWGLSPVEELPSPTPVTELNQLLRAVSVVLNRVKSMHGTDLHANHFVLQCDTEGVNSGEFVESLIDLRKKYIGATENDVISRIQAVVGDLEYITALADLYEKVDASLTVESEPQSLQDAFNRVTRVKGSKLSLSVDYFRDLTKLLHMSQQLMHAPALMNIPDGMKELVAKLSAQNDGEDAASQRKPEQAVAQQAVAQQAVAQQAVAQQAVKEIRSESAKVPVHALILVDHIVDLIELAQPVGGDGDVAVPALKRSSTTYDDISDLASAVNRVLASVLAGEEQAGQETLLCEIDHVKAMKAFAAYARMLSKHCPQTSVLVTTPIAQLCPWLSYSPALCVSQDTFVELKRRVAIYRAAAFGAYAESVRFANPKGLEVTAEQRGSIVAGLPANFTWLQCVAQAKSISRGVAIPLVTEHVERVLRNKLSLNPSETDVVELPHDFKLFVSVHTSVIGHVLFSGRDTSNTAYIPYNIMTNFGHEWYALRLAAALALASRVAANEAEELTTVSAYFARTFETVLDIFDLSDVSLYSANIPNVITNAQLGTVIPFAKYVEGAWYHSGETTQLRDEPENPNCRKEEWGKAAYDAAITVLRHLRCYIANSSLNNSYPNNTHLKNCRMLSFHNSVSLSDEQYRVIVDDIATYRKIRGSMSTMIPVTAAVRTNEMVWIRALTSANTSNTEVSGRQVWSLENTPEMTCLTIRTIADKRNIDNAHGVYMPLDFHTFANAHNTIMFNAYNGCRYMQEAGARTLYINSEYSRVWYVLRLTVLSYRMSIAQQQAAQNTKSQATHEFWKTLVTELPQ